MLTAERRSLLEKEETVSKYINKLKPSYANKTEHHNEQKTTHSKANPGVYSLMHKQHTETHKGKDRKPGI